MKKKVYTILFLLLFVSGCTLTNEIITPEPIIPSYLEDLKALGYNEEQIEILKEKLTEENLDLITEYDYIEILTDIINDENYNEENLKKYLDYYEMGMSSSALVYIVNNDITYTYNEKLVNIMNHKYFIAKNLDRYMNYKSDDINEIITNVNVNIDRAFYTGINKTDTSKEFLLIANKYYQLEKDYYYGKLVTMSTSYSNKNGQKLNEVAYEAFKKLVSTASKEGLHIRNLSAYRSYQTQYNLYNNYKNNNGLEWADKWSARAGHSEHQTGLALDVTTKGSYSFDNFENTKEFVWIKDNAHKFGFILRYPKGKEYITGYSYEPWHYRYVGIDAATYIYENNITFEEYYAYFVEK